MDRSIRYSLDAVKNDDDAELLKKLKLSWGYDVASNSFKEIGKLFMRKRIDRHPLYWISNLRSAENFAVLTYPVELDRRREWIGIFDGIKVFESDVL